MIERRNSPEGEPHRTESSSEPLTLDAQREVIHREGDYNGFTVIDESEETE